MTVEVEELRQQLNHYREIIDASPNCIKVLDLDGRLLDMNEGGRSVMEVQDFERCRFLPWQDFWTGKARLQVEHALERARAGLSTTFEGPAATMGGTVKWWEVSVSPVVDTQGQVRQLIAISRDMTARRATQHALEQLNATLEERVEQRTSELETERSALDAFVAFAERSASTTDVHDLAGQAVEVLRATLGEVSVAYYDLEGDLWKARVWSSDFAPEVMEVLARGIPTTAPSYAEALETREAVFVAGWDAKREHVASTEAYGAGAFYPCYVNQQPQGLLAMGIQRAGDWSDRERAVFRSVGRSLVLALERAETNRRTAEQNSELEARSNALVAFESLSYHLTVRSDAPTLIRRALEIVLALLPPGFAAYWQPVGNLWRLMAQVGTAGTPALQQLMEAGLPVGTTPSLDIPYQTRQPFFQDIYDKALDVSVAMVDHLETVATLPVMLNGQVAGILNVPLFEHRPWSAADKAVLLTTARSLGLALEGVQSVEQLERERSKLEVANEELEAFAYSVSHDLRTPLRHIKGFAQLAAKVLKQPAPNLAKVEEYLGVVNDGADRMDGLINSMLDLSRTGWTELRTERVNLTELVEQARLELEADTQARPIEWQVSGLPVVRGDRASLQQVLTNLLSNAVKFTRHTAHPTIEVRAEARPDEWIIRVQDNGAGFDPQYAGKLFGVFQRLHAQRDFPGTGVGLATVRRIVVRHGGRVFADGRPGQGATFGFTLPRERSG
ncbi:ATP-binding protein [Deinococcus sonorensis]|uniref:histidine kinase n=2 Tax=Deinococcus sonorensis TaxID=309891 RepID=A0AAU7U4M6_9DEIO